MEKILPDFTLNVYYAQYSIQCGLYNRNNNKNIENIEIITMVKNNRTI